MRYKPYRTKLYDDQSGMVSIIVAMLIMFLLTLTVLAMSHNANREQRQALDRQLSSEAFYAAESGIGDTIDYIRQTPGANVEKLTDCGPLSPAYSNQIDGELVKYSCILYDKHPTTLDYGKIDTDKAEMIPLQSATGLKTLIINWQQADGSGNVSGCPTHVAGDTFKPAATWSVDCSAGMLRQELISLQDLNRDALINNDSIVYIFPQNAATAPGLLGTNGYGALGPANQGSVVRGSCSNPPAADIHFAKPKLCYYQTTNINLAANQRMYLRLRSIYKANTVSIAGIDASGNPVKFENAQIVIDSTGKANDVLKRLQVRVPVQTEYATDDFGIHTADDVCKLLGVYPNFGQSLAPCLLN
jgi:hypothetical protein